MGSVLEGQTLPLHPCGQLTRCFSAVGELLVLVGSVKRFFFARVRLDCSRSSKVIDFGTGTNGKRVVTLRRFRDIAGFCAHDPNPIPP